MNRNEKFDFYKGILMFGVIWGHTITNLLCGSQNNIDIHWIMRTYDMPLFMVISGYFMSFTLSRKSLYQAIKDKVTMILLPTLIWGLIITYGKSVGPLYFLWAIFYSSLIMAILCKVVKSNVLRSIICVIIVISLNFAPFTWSNMSYLFPFFALGYFYNELDVRIPKMGGGITLPVYYPIVLLGFKLQYLDNGNLLQRTEYKQYIYSTI